MAPETFKYHDNEVHLQVVLPSGPSPLSSGSFTVTAFKISSGQDPESKNKIGDVHSFTAITVPEQKFVFTCGRHGTSEVADFWNTNIPPNKNTFGHTAGDLNFAFIGTLALQVWTPKGSRTVTFPDMGFAQGHSGSINNWWFGGKNCVHGSGNTVSCTGTDQNGESVKFTFLRGDGLLVNTVIITDMAF
ncbi:hypothetical protein L218DRAFT_882841 [Marasmius fiardii PR-910]|nr:hypothetical protein L218DRAFT_882841 [Marasmius fiardii PR-910]